MSLSQSDAGLLGTNLEFERITNRDAVAKAEAELAEERATNAKLRMELAESQDRVADDNSRKAELKRVAEELAETKAKKLVTRCPH